MRKIHSEAMAKKTCISLLRKQHRFVSMKFPDPELDYKETFYLINEFQINYWYDLYPSCCIHMF